MDNAFFDANDIVPSKEICKKVARLCDLSGNKPLAKKILTCSTFIEYDEFKGFYIDITKRNFCKDKLCPVCQVVNRNRDNGKNNAVAKYIAENYPSAKIFHVTLTIKNPVSIHKSVLVDLNNAFIRLIKRKKVDKNLLGYYKSIEITYNGNKGFHPHIHVIMVFSSTFNKGSDNYISLDEWLPLWQDALNGKYLSEKVSADEIRNTQGVYIATDKHDKNKQYETTTAQSIAKVMYYMTKHVRLKDYTTHSEEENIYVLTSLHEATKNMKLKACAGIFKTETTEYKKADKIRKQSKKEARANWRQLKNYKTKTKRYNGKQYVSYGNDDTQPPK